MKLKKSILKKVKNDEYLELLLSISYEVSMLRKEVENLSKRVGSSNEIDLENLSKEVKRLKHYKSFPVDRRNTKSNKLREFLRDNKESSWTIKELMKKTKLSYNTLWAELRYMEKVRKEVIKQKINSTVWFKWRGIIKK